MARTISNYGGQWGFYGYPEAAVLTTTQGSNKDLQFVADNADSSGNSITIRYVNPGTANASLSVTVSGSAITVNLATDAGSLANSTASQIMSAVNGNTSAAALVNASLASGSDGSGKPVAFTATALSCGRPTGIGRGATRPTTAARRSIKRGSF